MVPFYIVAEEEKWSDKWKKDWDTYFFNKGVSLVLIK